MDAFMASASFHFGECGQRQGEDEGDGPDNGKACGENLALSENEHSVEDDFEGQKAENGGAGDEEKGMITRETKRGGGHRE